MSLEEFSEFSDPFIVLCVRKVRGQLSLIEIIYQDECEVYRLRAQFCIGVIDGDTQALKHASVWPFCFAMEPPSPVLVSRTL